MGARTGDHSREGVTGGAAGNRRRQPRMPGPAEREVSREKRESDSGSKRYERGISVISREESDKII